jgi:hypothetical protein
MVIGNRYLFRAPIAKGKPWSRWHARDLLERAEAAAELDPVDGGDFHPYRRKWATERKLRSRFLRSRGFRPIIELQRTIGGLLRTR